MALDRPSGSAVEAWLECLGSDVLQKASDGGTRDADRGQCIHKFLERVRAGIPADVALGQVPEQWRQTCAQIDIEALPEGEPEVAYAYDVVTGKARKLGRGIERDYARFGLTPSEIPLTIDLERVEIVASATGASARIPEAIDYKSGFRAVTPAERNPQLLTAAVAMTTVMHAEMARGAIAYVNQDGDLVYDRATYDELSLTAHAYRLRRRWQETQIARRTYAATGEVQTKRGHWCTYCAAKASCPAYAATRLELSALAPTDWVARFRAEMRAPGGRARAYLFVEEVSQIAGALSEVVREDVRERGEIQLDDGRIVALAATQRRDLDPEITRAVVAEAMGDDAASRVVVPDVTLDRLRRVAGKAHKELLARVDARGGVTRSTSMRLDAKRPKEGAK